jgi:glycosyltransferase involved in cell wall biosynthesis
VSVSILILTRDEEVNLPGCLESVAWSDDVVVLDSGSTDGTRGVAESGGARWVERAFDDYATHRNWALETIDFRNEWVFSLDADERMEPALSEEVRRAAAEAGEETAGFRVRYRNMLCGRWIRHASLYPTWLIRLFRPERVRYEARAVNAHPVVDGEVGRLEGHFEHHSFNKGFEAWLAKHNRYSTMEAAECLRELREGRVDWRGLTSGNPMRRRRALKNLSFRLPGRPWVKFGYMYFLRLGFLDGRAGLTYCALQAIYEYMICLKVRELKRREAGLPV